MSDVVGFEYVTDEELEKCYSIVARFIRDFGDAYIPIFKSLHEEKEKRVQNQDLKAIALRLAK